MLTHVHFALEADRLVAGDELTNASATEGGLEK
jgi:hypothetical protein